MPLPQQPTSDTEQQPSLSSNILPHRIANLLQFPIVDSNNLLSTMRSNLILLVSSIFLFTQYQLLLEACMMHSFAIISNPSFFLNSNLQLAGSNNPLLQYATDWASISCSNSRASYLWQPAASSYSWWAATSFCNWVAVSSNLLLPFKILLAVSSNFLVPDSSWQLISNLVVVVSSTSCCQVSLILMVSTLL